MLPLRYGFSGICGLARTRVLRGIAMIRSSGPQLASGGNSPLSLDVTSRPTMTKSPFSSSKMSGQPCKPGVCAPPRCGSGPSLRNDIPIIWGQESSLSICNTAPEEQMNARDAIWCARKFDANGKIALLLLESRSAKMERCKLSHPPKCRLANYSAISGFTERPGLPQNEAPFPPGRWNQSEASWYEYSSFIPAFRTA